MLTSHLTRSAAILAGILILSGLVACGAQSGADKSGATAERDVTLTLQMPDADYAAGREFARAVQSHTKGSVTIRLGTTKFPSDNPANEVALDRAIQGGDEQGGVLPARAWAAGGVDAFRALLAPFELTTRAAATAFAQSDGAKTALAALPKSVIGLALLPDQMRRFMTVKRPLLDADQAAGARLRIIDNPQTQADLEAIGAQPVQGLTSDDVSTGLAEHQLDGAETAAGTMYDNSYANIAKHLSGFSIFPKYQSIVLNRKAWDGLSGAQQDAVTAAAADTVTWASTQIAGAEQSSLTSLCKGEVKIDVPSAAQLKTLTSASRSVASSIESDKGGAAVLAAMRSVPGAGPRRLATPLPAACSQTPGTDVKVTKPAAPFPEGTYVTKVKREDFVRHNVTNPTALHDTTFTTRIKDGHWVQSQKPTFPDQCPGTFAKAEKVCAGTYKLKGDQVTFNWIPDGNLPGDIETVKWSFFNGVLHFINVSVPDTGSQTIYDTPWQKVG